MVRFTTHHLLNHIKKARAMVTIQKIIKYILFPEYYQQSASDSEGAGMKKALEGGLLDEGRVCAPHVFQNSDYPYRITLQLLKELTKEAFEDSEHPIFAFCEKLPLVAQSLLIKKLKARNPAPFRPAQILEGIGLFHGVSFDTFFSVQGGPHFRIEVFPQFPLLQDEIDTCASSAIFFKIPLPLGIIPDDDLLSVRDTALREIVFPERIDGGEEPEDLFAAWDRKKELWYIYNPKYQIQFYAQLAQSFVDFCTSREGASFLEITPDVIRMEAQTEAPARLS